MPARPGPANLITDVGGLLVGNAEDAGALTGVTVVRPTRRAVAAVAVAGGGPGTRETDALGADTLVDAVDAIVLSGGSVYGLGAADGVAGVLGAAGQGYRVGERVAPIVPAAILFDLANAGDKNWGEEPPYRRLGREALAAGSATFALGRAGAAFGARAGQDRGGLGSASIETDDGLQVGALMAVNAYGSLRLPGSRAFWAWPFEQGGEFGGVRPVADFSLDLDDWGASKRPEAAARSSTTIGVVACNVALAPAEAQRVAKIALAGLARAVRPVFLPFDGDVLFVLSTAGREVEGPRPMLLARLGELAAGCVARAAARGVWLANEGAAG
jgi:L-aminopeptidase/D-esterase-like protein